MARNTFTRTVHTTYAEVEIIDLFNKSFEDKIFTFNGIELDEKQVKKEVEKRGYIVAEVKKIEIVDSLYSMSIEDFIKYGSLVE